jgi:beta-lactam-binding protein with PASTA domain/tetratricopeptide (TPR) repeat protein
MTSRLRRVIAHALLKLSITVLAVSSVAFAGSSTVLAQTGAGLAIPAGPPAALVKRIVINNQQQQEAGMGQATVTRAGISAAVTTDLLLYRGDVIETFADTKVTVLFLDAPSPEKDNEVIIDANARVGISSTDSWWGRVWAKVKGVFNSKTTYAQMGAVGTEYELNVLRGEERSTLIVIEGSVEVRKGNFNLVGRNAGLVPQPARSGIRYPQFVFANFTSPTFGQEQFGRPLEVLRGQVTTVGIKYNVHSDCHQKHTYEFRSSDSTEWFQLLGTKRFEVGPERTVQVERDIQINSTKLTPGLYQAHVYAICLDCAQEQRCNQAQLDWVYNITVTADISGVTPTPTATPTPTPAPTPTPTLGATNQFFVVKEKEDSTVTRNFDQPVPAATPRILSVLDWTNQVILRTQPSYSTQNLIPHFSTNEQRSQNFRDARERAVLSNEPGSNRVLGDVYSDWGQGAWAVKAYNKEKDNVTGQQTQPDIFLVDRAEAYRLTGQLSQARDVIISSSESSSSKGQNLLGNINFDFARIALDKGDKPQADNYLEQARTYYASALSAPQTTGQTGFGGNTTVKTNLAKTQIAQGDLILQTSTPATPQTNAAAQLAKTKYSSAMQLLADTQQADSTYPFGVTELGRAYQGWGDAVMLEGNKAAADESYAKAKAQYTRVVGVHPDCAEAYFNLGDLSDDTGDKAAAKDYYRRAIKVRPEQPASYYPLALLLQKENPQLAAALASTYLQLEGEAFKQGDKAKNAVRITRGEYVTPPPRIGSQIVTSTDLVVPNVLNKSLAEATSAIETAGLAVRKTEKRSANPNGTVLEQRPVAGTTVARGATIEIVVSTGGGGTGEPGLVPNVLNMSQTDATAALENAGLRVGKLELKSENKPKNTVVKQNPSAGKKAAAGSAVDLVVSAGKLVDVPDLIKEREQTARKKLADKGLTVGTVSQRPDCDLVGKVLEQNPRHSNLKVEVGTAVDFVLGSLGENPVTVPNLRGQRQREAQSTIQDLGFTLRDVKTDESDQPEGTIVDQSPTAGSQFAKGCPVNVRITIAIPWVVVDNYVGMSVDEARRGLSAITLYGEIRDRESDGNPGIVLDQNPPAGSRVRHRSPVLLWVSVPRPELVPVPGVTGKTLYDAIAILERARLRVGRVNYQLGPANAQIPGVYVRAPIGCFVESQNPVEGRRVPVGTPVNMLVIYPDKSNPQDCSRRLPGE